MAQASKSRLDTRLLIGSSLVDGQGQAEDILNPFTGESIVQVPEAAPDQVDEAVAAARDL